MSLGVWFGWLWGLEFRLPRGAVRQVAASNGVSQSQLNIKWAAFAASRAAGVSEEAALRAADVEHRGGSNRLLTVAEEDEWAAAVAAANDAGDAMSGAACLDLARHTSSRCKPYPLRSQQQPAFHRSWLSRALRRHRLAFGQPRYRDNQRPPDPALVAKHFADGAKWVQRVGRRRMFGLDEISWRVTNPPRLVVGRVGSRRVVRAMADVRHAFTATLIVNAAGDKLKVVVVKDAQPRSRMVAEKRRYGKFCHFVASRGGWATSAVMVNIITHVIAPQLHGEQGVLVMDVASAHTTNEVLSCLEHHNIIPLWVPPRGTGLYQPLDVTVMGVVRAKARRMWREHRANIGVSYGPALSKFFAIRHLIQAFKEVSRETIVSGWTRGMGLPLLPAPPSASNIVTLERVGMPSRTRLRVVRLMPRRLRLTLAPAADDPVIVVLRRKRFAAPQRTRAIVKRRKLNK